MSLFWDSFAGRCFAVTKKLAPESPHHAFQKTEGEQLSTRHLPLLPSPGRRALHSSSPPCVICLFYRERINPQTSGDLPKVNLNK